VLTGRNSVRDAVATLRAGARHYLVKPWDDEELLFVVEREARAVDLSELSERTNDPEIFWGSCAEMQRLRRQLTKLASHPATPVLIEGETGVGKEVIAQELHRLSDMEGSFVALNCASIPTELMESEMFGHEKGSFTGADQRRRGLAELARNGTLFLDEIGELALPLQAKLLRFLQDFRFRRVGGEAEIISKCRIVTATHRDLDRRERDGQFRSDLFFRLAVVRVRIPPLRERRDDLLPLANFLLENQSRQMAGNRRYLDSDAEFAIFNHEWRGNVRELKNRLERALVLSDDVRIQAHDLDLPTTGQAISTSAATPVANDEHSHLLRVLEECDWNVSRAARRLGVPRHRLRYRMTKYGIKALHGVLR
jgi:two-component system response regulator AtoC